MKFIFIFTYIYSLAFALGNGPCGEISSIAVITADIHLNRKANKAEVSFNQEDFFNTLKKDKFNPKGIISISIKNNTIVLVVDDTPGILEARYSMRILAYLSKFEFNVSIINNDVITISNFKFIKTDITMRLWLKNCPDRESE